LSRPDRQDRNAVYHTHSGEVFATQPDCPHRGGPLADGLIGGTTILCPLHDRSFDLRTGKNLSGDCTDIRAYPVILRQDGGIALQIDLETSCNTQQKAQA
jgi:nitrite reductase (NADH) small subunit